MPSFREIKVRGVAGLHKGDQIAVDRGDIKHHMIVIEDPTDVTKVHVIHYYNDFWPGAKGASRCCGKSGVPLAEVREDKMDIFSDVSKRRVYRIDYYECFPPDITVQNAKSKLGEGKFSPFTNNCEHFATWCKTGVHESSQIKAFWEEGKKVHGAKHATIATINTAAKVANVAIGKKVALATDNLAKQAAHMEWAKTVLENVGHDRSIQMLDPFMISQTIENSPTTFMYPPVPDPTMMLRHAMRQRLDRHLEMSRFYMMNELSYTAAGGRVPIEECLEAAAKSEGTSFSRTIMENQGKISIGLTAAVEGYYFLSRTRESMKKCDRGEISKGEFVEQVATHAVKGVATGAATFVGGTWGQTLGSAVGLVVGTPLGPLAPAVGVVGGVVGGIAGGMTGKAAVLLGGWLVGS